MENDIVIKICVFVVEKDRLLLLKEWSNKKNGYYLNIIKGTYDKHNESLFDCARREAKEEAGIEIELTDLLNCTVGFGKRNTFYFSFIARMLRGNPSLALEDEQKKRGEDITEINFYSKDEIKKMKRENFISGIVFDSVHQWLEDKIYPLEIIKHRSFK